MELTVINGGPDQGEPIRVPVLARRGDVERAAALYRQALDLIREAAALRVAGDGGGVGEDAAQGAEWDVKYLEGCLQQPGEYIVVAFEVEEDDWESPAILERQRVRNALIGAGDFILPDLGEHYIIGAEG